MTKRGRNNAQNQPSQATDCDAKATDYDREYKHRDNGPHCV